MKHFSLLAVCLLSLMSSPAWADSGWTIKQNDIDLNILPDGDLLVTERIVADFQKTRHGIIRVLPVRYTAGMHQYALRFQLLSIVDEKGNNYSKQVKSRGDAMRIRIGDANKFLSGTHVYIIEYRIERALLWEDDRVVLRWDAIGNQWDVSQGSTTVTVHLPETLSNDDVVYQAWTGYKGSSAGNYSASRNQDGSILFKTEALHPHQGITVSISLPAESIARASLLSRSWGWAFDNLIYMMFPLVCLCCYIIWLRRGRDLPGRGSIVVQYEPPAGMTPLQVGTLLDERMDLRDVSAAIISFATRGLLSIESKPGRYSFSEVEVTFRKLSRPENLKSHEALLFDSLFSSGDEANLSDLKETYFAVLPRVRTLVFKGLTSKGFFDGNPEHMRSKFLASAIPLTLLAMAIIAMIQFLDVGRIFQAPLLISGILSLAVLLLTSRFIPRKTSKGRRAWEHISGLEEYIRRAEAEQIAMAEKQNIFESLLPYAMVFGLSEKWARAFEGIYTEPPAWYHGADRQGTSTEWLAHRLSSTGQEMQKNLFTAPRSEGSSSGGFSSGGFSGGGSSGGGFGGGGGSSW